MPGKPFKEMGFRPGDRVRCVRSRYSCYPPGHTAIINDDFSIKDADGDLVYGVYADWELVTDDITTAPAYWYGGKPYATREEAEDAKPVVVDSAWRDIHTTHIGAPAGTNRYALKAKHRETYLRTERTDLWSDGSTTVTVEDGE